MDPDSEHTDVEDELFQSADSVIGDIDPPPEAILELDFAFDALSHPRRRYLCYSLLAKTRWTLPELATKLVAWEQGVPETAVSEYDRDEMYVSLYHAHIPSLIEMDILKYETPDESEVVVAGPNATQVLSILEIAGATVDTEQESHARRAYNARHADSDQ